MILLGNTSEKIRKSVLDAIKESKKKADIIKIHKVSDMQSAVKYAFETATGGDKVVLSPACASFDLYPNFEERGNHFKKLVRNL